MFNFCKEIETIFKIIAQYALKEGVAVYFVGGMVRDALMMRDIGDIDILVEGSAIVFARGLKEACDNGFASTNVPCAENELAERVSINIKSTHESFDTVKVQINDIELDFASTREEDYPKSGCLPVVKNIGCPVKSDLKRRDFTINAIAARILWVDNALKYELTDIFNGIDDINKGVLRVLHDKSYNDDPTRVLRGIDFALRFNFAFSNSDEKLIENFLKAPDREGLSIDRVKLTLKKLFSFSARAKAAYEILAQKKIYKIWTDTAEFKIEWAKRLIMAVDIFKVNSSDLFLDAIFENKKFEKIVKDKKTGSNYEIYNFFKTFSNLDLALFWAIFDDNDAKFYFENLKSIKPEITGYDLISLGFKQGKIIGEILDAIQKEKLNNPSKFKNNKDEIEFALNSFRA